MKQPGFFDIEERLARLGGLGDQLEAFSRTVNFEVFRSDLEKALAYSDGRTGGRPPFDPVLMFKILVIQTLFNRFDTTLRDAGYLPDVRPDPGCYAGGGPKAAQYQQ